MFLAFYNFTFPHYYKHMIFSKSLNSKVGEMDTYSTLTLQTVKLMKTFTAFQREFLIQVKLDVSSLKPWSPAVGRRAF